MKRAERQGRSAKFRRSNRSQLNIVNLKIDDVPVVSTSLPKKLELLIKQHEYEHRMHGRADDPRTANSAQEVHPLFGTMASDQMIINASKSAPNVRPRPYRPISIHQYLTLTELKDTAVQDGDKQLGRPTRTTLLRDRQRRRSVSTGCEASQKNGQKQALRVPTRYEAVTNILSSMIPSGQSLHSFISGARYNRSHWIESLGILSLDSDLPNLSSLTLNAPKWRPMSVPHDVSYAQKAPPESPVDVEDSVFKDEESSTVFPLLSNEQTTPRPAMEHRSLKVAWEDAKLMATVSDKTAADKVCFESEEATCEGSVLGIHRDKGQSIARPSSVRLFTFPLAKPGADMESVMIHGTSITGSLLPATSKDFSICHPSQAEWSKEMRRSWSARMEYPDPLDPEALSRLGPLKVTGVRVSGEGGKAGGTGGKVSAFRLNRIKNGFASFETADCSGGCQADENCGFQFKVDPDGGSDHLEVVEQHKPGRSTDLENFGRRSEEEGKISLSDVQLASLGAAEALFGGGDKQSEEVFASGRDSQLEQLPRPEGSLFKEETDDIDSFEIDSKVKGHSEDTRIETEGRETEEPSGREDDVLFFITEEDSGDVGNDSGGYHGNGKEAEQQNSDSDDLDSAKDSAM